MKSTLQVIFACGLLCLAQVHAETSTENDDMNRGLFDILLGGAFNNNNNNNNQDNSASDQVVAVPPPVYAEQAPHIPQIPVVPVHHEHHNHNNLGNLGMGNLGLRPFRPAGILNNLLNRGSSEEKLPLGLNMDWVRFALQKCAVIDPRTLTAILPTKANQLQEPRIYYFENSTSNTKTWSKAQEWCSKNGMQLATVNNLNENKVLQSKMKEIFAGSAAGGVDAPNAFWIGLNRRNGDGTWQYVGDSSSTFVDWHPAVDTVAAEPTPAAALCAAMSQRFTAENIHFDAKACDDNALKFRYVCEVSDACVALFMSRYRTQFIIPTHHHHHNHHIHSLENLVG